MNETKLVCDIMSTICCYIQDNPSKELTTKHLVELFINSPLQNVDINSVFEHMADLKSKA